MELYTLITGASSGIGQNIALRLAAGRRLILGGRDAGRLDAVRRATGDPDRHLLFQEDLSHPESAGTALQALLAREEAGVDAFVSCAGVFQAAALRAFTHPMASALMNVNFLAPVELCRVMASRRTNGGHLRNVVFISSVSAKRGVSGFSLYAATKGALDAFMKSLAVEMAPRVRVNSVLPGAVETSSSDAELLASAGSRHPLGTGQASDISAMVAFLLSEDARWITGQRFVVDGGWSC